MHEILTIQAGQKSNYLCTHLFNAYESYFSFDTAPPTESDKPEASTQQDDKKQNEEVLINHDLTFFAGLTPTGVETYLPRTLIYDLKPAFGSLRKINALYDTAGENPVADALATSIWPTQKQPSTIKESSIPFPAYQAALETASDNTSLLTPQTVQYWSDYNRLYYHPNSLQPIPQLLLPTSQRKLAEYSQGTQLFESLAEHLDNPLEADFRHQLERADNFQGVNLVVESDSGWAGFGTEYLRGLRDDFGGKKEVWCWGLEQGLEGLDAAARRERGLNLAKWLVEAVELGSLVLPLVAPTWDSPQGVLEHGVWEGSSLWHSTALLSAGVETALLPLRVQSGGLKMGEVGEFLTLGAEGETERRNIVGLGLGFEGDRNLELGWDERRLSAAFPCKGDHTFTELRVERYPHKEEEDTRDKRENRPKNDDEEGQKETWYPQHPIPFPTPTSFPANMFRRTLNPTDDKDASPIRITSASYRVRAGSVIQKVAYLKSVVQTYASSEDKEEMGHKLETIRESYTRGWDLDEEDSDWDD
ncbi:tubulin nucleotide-binding domain-like protein [Ascobolus immersus RN42]|uniref:Tubulin nucleotide-binding domain-like protein n=1 Tax=Ascobolus immersus RN42 TaxID=1160509 RepID=A0A3N4IBL3_ASCIM|nr:tubulin nucleotide-binding domain-like protein [Ascobolus immersus RN42]